MTMCSSFYFQVNELFKKVEIYSLKKHKYMYINTKCGQYLFIKTDNDDNDDKNNDGNYDDGYMIYHSYLYKNTSTRKNYRHTENI